MTIFGFHQVIATVVIIVTVVMMIVVIVIIIFLPPGRQHRPRRRRGRELPKARPLEEGVNSLVYMCVYIYI